MHRHREQLSGLGFDVVASALEHLPDACVLCRAVRDADAIVDLTLVWMNARGRGDYPTAEASFGKLASELWPQMVENGLLQRFLRVAETGEEDGGEVRWSDAARYKGAYYEWAARRVAGDHVMWIVRDASERLARTLENEARVNAILETVPDAVIVIDQAGTVLSANEATAKMFGWPPSELAGRNVNVLMPDDEAAKHDGYLAAYLRTGHRKIIGIGRDVVARHRSGRTFKARLAVGETIIQGRRVFTGVLHDLTQRHELEAKLRRAQQLELVGQLAGSLAHDFNNVLTVITATTSWLRETSTSEERDAAVSEVAAAAERASSLTRQLLALSRRQIEPTQVVHVDEVVKRAGSMAARIVKKSVQVVVDARADGWHVRADPSLLEQALLNLVMNARDAMPDGGRLTLRAAPVANAGLDGAPIGPAVELAVEDTGTGIPPHVLPDIFEPFFTTKPAGRGTGLGLMTVKEFAESNGGRVFVESTVGRGTRMRLVLPCATDHAQDLPPPPSIAPRAQGTRTVLVVDDERAIRSATTRALGARGFVVRAAADAEEAARVFDAADVAVDVLVTDLSLPRKSGVDLARDLVAKRPALRVLFMSGYLPDAKMFEKLPPGSEFLAKPFTLADLTSKVEQLADAARATLQA